MNFLATIVLFAWIPAIIFLFAFMTPRKAVLMAFLIGWLFLPNGGFKIPGIPDYTKLSATSFGVLLGVLIFDSGSLIAIRPRLLDLPMVLWCCSPFVSSLSNNLGAYDGFSVVVGHCLSWGVPYLVGRAYLTDTLTHGQFATGMVTSALVYVPLILFESRMSPILHNLVYGLRVAGHENYSGFGPLGWRPSVFLQNSLALTLFMGSCALLAFWMWMSGWNWRIWGISLGPIVFVLTAATILCKSLGANVLMFLGMAACFLSRILGIRGVLYCLIAVPPLYMALRATGTLDGQKLIAVTETLATQRRAESLATRMVNEDRMVAKAMERPLFGWGGWSRSRVTNEDGKDITLADGLWIIVMGQQGLVGLMTFYLTLLLPCVLLACRQRGAPLLHAAMAPVMAFIVIVLLYAIDNLFNAMPNPLYVLALGGLASVYAGGVRVASVFSPQDPVLIPIAARRRQNPVFGQSR